MKKILSKLLGGALLFGLTMSLTSCEDILGHWEKPTPNPITPTVEDVIKYGFQLKSLGGVDLTGDATSLKMTNADGTLVAEAEVSAGKITITNTKLTEAGITAAADFWFEATVGADDKYIAKVNIDPTTLSPESDKTLTMATLGDMILDDGTFAASSSAGTKVAMIAYVGSDACEAGDAPYNHGLALALSDASTDAKWCNQTTGACLVSQKNSAAEAQGDMAGIANTDYLIDHAGTHTHSAATAARHFKYVSTADAGAHPTGTTEWFLPSAGQWQKMIDAYGLTKLMTDAGDYKGMSGDYYSSTERGVSLAWGIQSDGSSLSIMKTVVPTNVRSCLAF